MADSIESINSQRKGLFNKLRKTLQKLNSHEATPLDVDDIDIHYATVKQCSAGFDNLQRSALKLSTSDDAIKVQTDIGDEFDELHHTVLKKIKQIHRLLTPASTPNGSGSSSGGSNASGAAPDIKLPRLELPMFAGEFTEWASFHDLYKSVVHNNTKISAAQKLHYLKSSLQGEAADLIKSIAITDANYEKAWKLLVDRYDNKPQLVFAHVRELLGQPAMQRESAMGLKSLLDTTVKHLDAIAALGRDVTGWDDMLVVLVIDRLDEESRKQWELKRDVTGFPSFDQLITFLRQRARALEACDQASSGSSSTKTTRVSFAQHQNPPRKKTAFRQGSSYHTSGVESCALCKAAHSIPKCLQFQSLPVVEKKNHIRRLNLCFNCLGSGHSVSQCPSTSTCRKCNGKHHTLIHWESVSEPSSRLQSPDPAVPKRSANLGGGISRAVLSTALVHVRNSSGQLITCRALLDNGSELNFVTEATVQLLGVKRQRSDMLVTGICGEVSGQSRGLVKLDVHSRFSAFTASPELYILPKISGYQPQQPVSQDWSHLDNFQLADPSFHQPGKVDLLLGAETYYRLLKDKTVNFPGQPSIYDTKLGWIVSGSVQCKPGAKQTFSHIAIAEVQDQLAKFWELEELRDEPHLTPEEIICENHFASTHSRDETGRFVVALPFKKTDLVLGASKEQALRRLHQVERRLSKNPQHRDDYNSFMQEYLELGHMHVIPEPERREEIGRQFYLPHHFVLKETSTSTKFRVVFDGSAQSTTRLSLNETLMVGPSLQRDIRDILTRFLLHRYVFTADISKFFRQVLVRPEDRDFQRIVWRRGPQEPIQEFRLATVTYGTGPAPFLSSRALLALADGYGHQFPLAAEILRRDIYVDDVMTGGSSLETVLSTQSQLVQLLSLGQFPLVKWASNCAAVLEAVPEEQRETKLPLLFDSDDSVKALGLYWNPACDQFFFKVNLDTNTDRRKVTKRTLLSDTAKLYDPLGWLAPVIVKAKVLFQSLWKQNLGWDETLPEDLCEEWLRIRTGLFDLRDLRLDRHLGGCSDSEFQLHGFCDASQIAYAAAVYLRSTSPDGAINTRLISAKTKVAPVRIVSIPRLELCAAVLLSRLVTHVLKVVNVPIASVHTWSDSTVVLDWLAGLPCNWKTFVANRVSEIQGLCPREQWNHVPTTENPADCGSRGLLASELLTFDLWWQGPSWLRLDRAHWPKSHQRTDRTSLQEERTASVFTVQIRALDLTEHFSSVSKLTRVTAFVFRFLNNCRRDRAHTTGPLTPSELDRALLHWVKFVQSSELTTAIELIKDRKPIPKNLRSLQPFVDEVGLLRVGGRLANSGLPFERKFPLLLPQRHEFTQSLIRHEHERLLHGGAQLIHGSLSRRFWILNARKVIRKCLRSCVRCFRFRAQPMDQVMGNLPASRLKPSRPFLRTGVDYGGPFSLRTWKGRGGKIVKAYIALFVCFATKATHIELVTDLTTDAFLAALRRFVARRGRPEEMWSDNGTNFVGARNELKGLMEQFRTQRHNLAVADRLAMDGIRWTFIPPRAPHVGGLWEAGVKSAKHHMRRVIGDTTLTYEEMTTTLQQIEACLNSRPISPLTSDPSDLAALTPGHFLIGDLMTSIPEPDVTELPQNRLSRYQLLQQQTQHFWRRWHHEYLNTLQQRTKWTEPGANVKTGDLVLVKEDNLPPLKWRLARVLELHPGADNCTRVVTVKTATGNLIRDVRKLCRLPFED